MKKFTLVFAAGLMALPMTATAQDAQPAAGDASAAKEGADEERLICKRTAIVGSKFKKKLCGTQEYWDQMAQRGKDATREFQTRGRGVEPSG